VHVSGAALAGKAAPAPPPSVFLPAAERSSFFFLCIVFALASEKTIHLNS
jgi:hypothetical protein